MREPAFWWRPPGLMSSLLAPLGTAYGKIAEQRMLKRGTPAGIPVICIGNFTLGGAGKTPTALMIVSMLREMGATPYCLTRGYGGSLEGPHLVDVEKDSAASVGDEALLLARAAPTVVSRNRVQGAAFAKARGASVIVMDDGLQNASLAKSLTIAVVDGRRGIGNGQVFPSGPLRAPLDIQMKRCDALLVVGDATGTQEVVSHAGTRSVLHGRLAPDKAAIGVLQGRNVLAFAGIGDPDKFFATVESCGIAIAERRAFADHHRFTAEEAAELVMAAEHDGLSLLTTEKDHARMTGNPALAALATKAHVLPVTMMVDEKEALRGLLARALA